MPYLRATDSASQHLEEHHPQAPYIIGGVIHDGGRQIGDGRYQLRRAVLWCAILIQQVSCIDRTLMRGRLQEH